MRTNLLKGSSGDRDLAWYRERLRSEWPGDRRDAVQHLARTTLRGDLGADVLRRWLAPLVDDPDLTVALAATIGLVQVDPLGEVRRLRDRLREALDRPVDALALTAAVRIFLGAADEGLVAGLRESAEAAVRETPGGPRAEPAAWILGELGAAGDGSVIRTLVSLVSDPKVGNRAAAAWALGRSGRPEAFESLRTILLDTGNYALIEKALRGLGDADGSEVVDRMIDALRYDAPATVMTRLRALPSRFRRRRAPAEP